MNDNDIQDDLELMNWAISPAGLAACREAYEFAQRAGIRVTLAQVSSILLAGRQAEAEARTAGDGT